MPQIDIEEVYRAYSEKLRRFVLRKTGDPAVSEDLVSEIFIKLMKHSAEYDSERAALSTWVYTIAANCVTDWFRTRRAASPLPYESGEEGIVPYELIDFNGPDIALLNAENLRLLGETLQALPDRERDLVVLHYYSGLQLKEIAPRMGMSYANVKLLHKKALFKLRAGLSVAEP